MVKITVSHPAGPCMFLELNKTATIQDVKQFVYDEQGIPMELQLLMQKGYSHCHAVDDNEKKILDLPFYNEEEDKLELSLLIDADGGEGGSWFRCEGKAPDAKCECCCMYAGCQCKLNRVFCCCCQGECTIL